MSHKPYLDWMQAALDAGDAALAPDQRTQLHAHLAGCADCQAAWERLNEVERLFRGAPLAEPRPGFTGRFRARLAAQRRRSRAGAMWGALALGLGAVATAGLVLPVGLGLFVSMVRVAQQPATAAALFSGLGATADLTYTVVDALLTAALALAGWAVASPLTWIVGVAALALTGVWLYVMRRLAPEGYVR